MSVWRWIVPNPGIGEKTVPAPNAPNGTGQEIIKIHGTWIHESDWRYINQLQFACRGVMVNGFSIGCPDAKQMATRPPEPPVAPPKAIYPEYFREDRPKRRAKKKKTED